MDRTFKLRLPDGELCDCSIRISRRSKTVSLRLSDSRGLELVVPPFHSIEKAHAFAVKSAPWAQRVLRRRAFRMKEAMARPDAGKPLPDTLELKASGESLPIDYIDSKSLDFISVRIDTPGRLTVQGDIGDIAACQAAIKDWLRSKAIKLFAKKIEDVAAECGLRYESVKVRDQRGRWGSCSRNGRINLNFRLLLMEPEFLRHVIVHELCHTKELNHSGRFWRLVESFEPDAKRIRANMREAGRALPSWLAGDIDG